MHINRSPQEIRRRLQQEMEADRATWGCEPPRRVDGSINPKWKDMINRRRRIETLRRALAEVTGRAR